MEQINLFDFTNILMKSTSSNGDIQSNISLFDKEEKTMDLLNPKEKITNLKRTVKEILKDKQNESGISDLFDISFNFKDDWSLEKRLKYVFKRIGSKIIKPLLDSFSSYDDIYKIEEILKEEGREISFEPLLELCKQQELCFRCLKESKTMKYTSANVLKFLPVKVQYNGPSGCISFNGCLKGSVTDKKHKALMYLTSGRAEKHRIVDIPTMLGELLFFKAVRDYLRNDINLKKVRYRFFKSLVCIVKEGEKHLFTNIPSEKLYALYLPSDLDTPGVEEELKEYSLYPKVTFVIEEQYKKVMDSGIPEKNFKFWNSTNNFIALFLRGGIDSLVSQNFYQEDYTFNKNYVSLMIDRKNYKPLLEIFTLMINENIQLTNEAKKEHKMISDYAASFETKKNIPLKVQECMKKSKFNNYFGYVEFDELVDLKKIGQIEEEFIAFTNMFDLKKHSDHSIRFRRLGKHRAGGLYFPYQRALCVDISSPSSMIHEYFHLIDYTAEMKENSCLSKQFKFFPIISKYTEVLDEIVSNLKPEHSFKSKWEGTTKFNRSYFLDPAEIFARCGEIYIKHILEIDNSLVGADRPYVYPTDNNELLKLIEVYYSSIINKKESITKTA